MSLQFSSLQLSRLGGPQLGPQRGAPRLEDPPCCLLRSEEGSGNILRGGGAHVVTAHGDSNLRAREWEIERERRKEREVTPVGAR